MQRLRITIPTRPRWNYILRSQRPQQDESSSMQSRHYTTLLWWPEATTTSWPQVLTTMGKNTFCRRVFRPDCIYIAHCNHSRDYNIGTVESHVNCDGVYSVFQYCNMQVNSVCMQWARGGRNSETAVKAGVYGGNALLFSLPFPDGLAIDPHNPSHLLHTAIEVVDSGRHQESCAWMCVCVCAYVCVLCVCCVWECGYVYDCVCTREHVAHLRQVGSWVSGGQPPVASPTTQEHNQTPRCWVRTE